MALTKVSGDFIDAGSITQGHLHSSHGITTTHIAEGDKLFFTNARVDSRIGSLSSSDLSEGTNLYYTDARARAAISGTGSLSYNSTTGVMSFTMPAQNTSNITEGSNLYYTDARADARITAASTSDLSEGTNLYYTDARADARITAADTDSLSEGSTNLYYTDARADARVALIVDSSPEALNTLNELAAALNDDADFSTTITTSIATKMPLAGGTFSGQVIFPSTGTTRPVLPNGFISRDDLTDTSGRHDIWGISERYYPSNSTTANQWGIQWSGTPNDVVFVGGGTDRFTVSLDEGNVTAAGTITATGGNSTQWNTAHSWGNHASGGYLTSSTGFPKGADIGGGANLNNYTTPGYFHQNSNAQAGNGSNYPASVAGMLTVAADGLMVYQTYQGYATHGTYERKYYNGTWESWHLIYDSGTFTNNSANWNTAYGWGDHAGGGYLTSFDITTQTDGKYIRSNADDTASGIITLTKNTATGLANNAFSYAKTVIGGLHFDNGNGPAANNGNQAAITFQGGTAGEAQAGIYVHNNNSQGTHMMFATTNSYTTGPQAGITLLNNGNVTIRGTVGASNFSGSSSGTNTGDQDLSSYATSATTLAGYGITNAIQKGVQIASGASWNTATRFGSTGDLSGAAGNHALSVRSENNNDAFMSFHIGSDYAVHFGLDGATNRMHVGGWSDGTGTQYQLYDSRDFSVASVLNSNVTLATLGYTGATNANYITNNNQLTNGAGYLTSSIGGAKFNFVSGSGGSTFGNNHYSMGIDIANGGWSNPNYSDLIIGYHTGIRIGASYTGIRFYNNSPTTDTNNTGHGNGNEGLIFTVGGATYGNTNTRVENIGYAGGSFRAPIFYDSDTNYYFDGNGTSVLSKIWCKGASANSAPRWDTSFHVVQSQHFYGHNGSQTLYFGESNPAIFGSTVTVAGVIDANGGHGGINITSTSILSSASSTWTGNPGGAGKIQYHSNRWYIVSDSSSNRIVQFRKDSLDKSYIDNDGRLMGAPDLRVPIYYDTNTSYYGDFASNTHLNTMSCAGGLLFGDYGVGVTGVYTSTRVQTIFNMGTSYKLPNNGASTGNAYGLYWSHPNAGSIGGASNLNDHGLLIINNGSFRAAISSRAVFSSDVRGTLFYDYNNTGYYVDPASTSNLNAATFAGDITVNGNQVITLGGNADVKFSVWSGTTYGIGMTSGVTLGNLNDYAMTFCMNNDADRGFWWGYSGQSKGAGAMSLTTNGKLYVTTHIIAPIYYDTNTAYYMDAASTANLNAVTLNYINYKNSNFRVGNSTTMNAITSGGQNVAFGPEALGACSTGTRNFAYGYAALAALTSGANNIAMGDATGYNVTSGSNNLLFGISAGRTGYQSPQSMAGVTTHNHQIHMGNESHTTARIQISWTVNSDARDKTDITPIDVGLEFVKQLNPVTYRWDKRSDYEDRTPDGTNKLPELTLGFLAQEVEVVEKSFGYDVANQTNLVVDRIPEQDHYGITYEKMVPILTKAIQEQQTIIDDLKSRLETLENN